VIPPWEFHGHLLKAFVVGEGMASGDMTYTDLDETAMTGRHRYDSICWSRKIRLKPNLTELFQLLSLYGIEQYENCENKDLKEDGLGLFTIAEFGWTDEGKLQKNSQPGQHISRVRFQLGISQKQV
jgi:hypothetical protein